MSVLTLGDLKIGLANLFDKRKEYLYATEMGKSYGLLLAKKREAIDALPESLTSGRPLTDQLAEADAVHDGWGGALWYFLESIIRAPWASAELKAKAARIRMAFIAKLGVLRDAWADEAAAAAKNRPKLKELEADLKSIATPAGDTLYEWVSAFLDAGDNIGTLLSNRAFIDAASLEKGEIISLRMTTIGLLGRFRNAVADEMAARSDLPANLDALLFGFFDELTERRTKASKPQAPQNAPPQAPQNAPPETPQDAPPPVETKPVEPEASGTEPMIGEK